MISCISQSTISGRYSKVAWGAQANRTSFDGFAISVKAGGTDMMLEVMKQCGNGAKEEEEDFRIKGSSGDKNNNDVIDRLRA